MKTKILLLTLFAFAITSLFAQEQKGEIIYTDYGPEGWSYQFDFTYVDLGNFFWDYDGIRDTLQLDLDHDGTLDCYFSGSVPIYSTLEPLHGQLNLHSYKLPWQHPYLQSCNYEIYNAWGQIINYSWIIGDTISNIPEWEPGLDGHTIGPGFSFQQEPFSNVYPRYVAFRIEKEEGWCYGWLEIGVERTYYKHGHGGWVQAPGEVGMPKVTVYRHVYCTIPNYPFRLGQTSFDWSLEEEQERDLATIHPNPTTGLVTVKGDNLCQVEVLNVMGQKVIAKQATEGETSIDLGNQPAGLYFINVIGQDGKRCVKKVVKQ